MGFSSLSTITACYNTGTVSGGTGDHHNDVGGVVGGSSSTITACYNTGSVSGSSSYGYVGGVVGGTYSTSYDSYYSTLTIDSCYFIDQAGDDVDYGVGTSTSSDFDYMILSSVSELNAVVTTMNTAAGDTYFVEGSPSSASLPYFTWEVE